MTSDGGPAAAFGHYELRSLLGRGGMGMVYEAYDTRRRRIVALKVLPEQLANDRQFVERFRREAYAAAQLSDPHIVPIHDFGEIDSRLFIDMQRVAGSDLADVLARLGRVPPDRAVRILRQAADALDAAHAAGVVHRDVKPSNLLVLEERGDFTYLVDFGIASVTGNTALSATGQLIGSPAYMAPERFEGGTVDGRADVYALACVLFEMVTGTRLVPPDAGLPAVMRVHLHEPPPPVGSRAPGLSPSWDPVIARGLAKDPARRYASAGELAAAAEHVLSAAVEVPRVPQPSSGSMATVVGMAPPPVPAPRLFGEPAVQGPGAAAPTAVDAPAPRGRRRRRWLVIGAVVAVAVAVATTVATLVTRPEPASLVLESTSEAGTGAFSPDFRTVRTALPGASLISRAPAGATATSRTSGATELLYRSTKGTGDCDRDGLGAYLAGQAAISKAWAAVLDADPVRTRLVGPDPRAFLATLTPVSLAADLRVTDHRNDGAGQGFPAVLEAGTAVLVDPQGVPRVRCISGSPLTDPGDPAPPGTRPADAWPGYDPGTVLTVGPAAGFVQQFGLTDPASGKPFRRPAGTAGNADLEQVLSTASPAGSYSLTGVQKACNLEPADCATSKTFELGVTVSGCTAERCVIHAEGRWNDTPLVRAGDVWRASGPMTVQYTCSDKPVPSTFGIELTLQQAAIVGSTWAVVGLAARYTEHADATTCTASDLAWDLTGRR